MPLTGDVTLPVGELVAVVGSGRRGSEMRRRRTSVRRVTVGLGRYTVVGSLHVDPSGATCRSAATRPRSSPAATSSSPSPTRRSPTSAPASRPRSRTRRSSSIEPGRAGSRSCPRSTTTTTRRSPRRPTPGRATSRTSPAPSPTSARPTAPAGQSATGTPDDVEPTVHVDDLAGHRARQVRREEDGRPPDVLGRDVRPQRRDVGERPVHLLEAGDARPPRASGSGPREIALTRMPSGPRSAAR